MQTIQHTSRIAIAIGDELRTFRAFITSAPTRLDAPSTITLYESAPADLAGFALSPDDLAPAGPGQLARLVLVDATAEAWQHVRYAEGGHGLVPPDHVMVSTRTLQLWLWRRLRTFSLEELHIARVC